MGKKQTPMTRMLHTFAAVHGEICDVLILWSWCDGVEIDGVYDTETGERFHLMALAPQCVKRITDQIEDRYTE